MKHPISLTILSAFLAMIFLLTMFAPANAHAYLVDSFPAAREHIERPVKTIKLRFSGKADANYSVVTLERDNGVVLAETIPATATTEIALPAPPLQLGRYRVHYRILSTDGDIVEGAVEFVLD